MINRILLINPPIQDFYQTEIRQEPLGLEYLVAILLKNGYNVFIFNALACKSRKCVLFPSLLSYLKKFYPSTDVSPFKLFTHFYHFGKSFEELQQESKDFNPDLIGISANFTPYFETVLKTAKVCKKILPQVPVVMGGHHATAKPGEILQSEYVDYVVLGEGEATFLELLETLSRGRIRKLENMAGIAFKNGLQLVINQPQKFITDLDSLPSPLTSQPLKHKMIITSRGCPRGCNFCSITDFHFGMEYTFLISYR